MSDPGVFEHLVKDLTDSDRQDMLARISANMSELSRPLPMITEESKHVDPEKEYQRMSFWDKMTVFFSSLFSRKSKNAVVMELLVRRLQHQIESSCPGLVRFTNDVYTLKMYQALERFYTRVVDLSGVLDAALIENKVLFFAFIGNWEFPDLCRAMEEKINPDYLIREYAELAPRDVKARVEKEMHTILDSISAEDRKRAVSHIAGLKNFHQLCLFPFTKCLGLFPLPGENPESVCFMKDMAVYLEKLAEIILSLTIFPTPQTFEMLFLFKNRWEQIDEENEEALLTRQMGRITLAAEAVRDFSRQIPIVKLLKYTKKNLNFQPHFPENQTEWYSVYRKFWFDRFEESFKQFSLNRKIRSLRGSMQMYLGVNRVPLLETYRKGLYEDPFYIKYELSLAFLSLFFNEIYYAKLNKKLKIILLQGEFYKKENHEDFVEAYNTLVRFPDRIKGVERSLSPQGEIYERMKQIQLEITQVKLRRLQLYNLAGQLNRSIETLLETGCRALDLLANIVKGVVYGNGGKYDTLSNISYIGGSSNSAFRVGIADLHEKIRSASTILSECRQSEKLLYERENKASPPA